MARCRHRMRRIGLTFGLAALVLAGLVPVRADELPVALTRAVPDGLDDLVAIEAQIQKVSDQVLPATVSVRIGRAQGSGVIVSREGYVLTAAHVIGGAGRDADLTLPDGRKLQGKTLGLNRAIDAGLLKISTEGEWPFVEMGDLDQVDVGDWCLVTGHPGGYQTGRPPVLRLGRVILEARSAVQTDCTLVGGDSGGPLFDMRGRVIGINSRIGRSTTWNFHVPISAYTTDWDRLVAGEDWGGPPPAGSAFLGLSGDDHPDGCQVSGVNEDLPAAKAGIRIDDVILKFDGKPVNGFDSLAAAVRTKKPGDSVEIELRRDGQTITVTAVLGRRPG
ncbi:MAG TPA: trypsin-like peptidase domain-containing protein [Planctomycetaceae bacterium]|nr:trypsin-like peptidase domain-containing protein [Planctomycetaceae bacterium]